MLLDPKLEKMMNIQYTNEVASALLYKNIAGFYDDKYFPGIASFFHEKYIEELDHAERFYKYINDRDGHAIISKIPEKEIILTENNSTNNDLLLPFYESLKHEQQVSSWIYQLCDVALDMKDHAAYKFLLWFADEQVEEEAEFLQLIAELELIKNDGGDLYKFDRRLGKQCKSKQK